MDILARDLGTLLADSSLSDVTFVVDGESFPAVSAVVAARSGYLRKLLLESSSDERWKSDRHVAIQNVTAAGFSTALNYMYTGQLGDIIDLPASWNPSVDKFVPVAVQAIGAGDLFELKELTISLSESFISKLDNGTLSPCWVLEQLELRGSRESHVLGVIAEAAKARIVRDPETCLIKAWEDVITHGSGPDRSSNGEPFKIQPASVVPGAEQPTTYDSEAENGEDTGDGNDEIGDMEDSDSDDEWLSDTSVADVGTEASTTKEKSIIEKKGCEESSRDHFPFGVACLGEDSVRKIIGFLLEDANADMQLLFTAISLWHNKQNRTFGTRKASELFECLDYKKMSPTFLFKDVSPSGLVSAQILQDALMSQALAAERLGMSFRSAEPCNVPADERRRLSYVTWTISNMLSEESCLTCTSNLREIRSSCFTIAGHVWTLKAETIMAGTCEADAHRCLSIFLALEAGTHSRSGGSKDMENAYGPDWQLQIDTQFVILNQRDPAKSMILTNKSNSSSLLETMIFNDTMSQAHPFQGYVAAISMDTLTNPANGFLTENGDVQIQIRVPETWIGSSLQDMKRFSFGGMAPDWPQLSGVQTFSSAVNHTTLSGLVGSTFGKIFNNNN